MVYIFGKVELVKLCEILEMAHIPRRSEFGHARDSRAIAT